jgi:2-polyprenyl-6-methoxyphenol hydroxylase-like FAD-dependent oxidoreductase
LEELFPGILDELVLAGAPVFDGDDLSQLHFCMGGHLAVRSGSAKGLSIYFASRPFLECHVRRRVRAIPNITLLDDHDVVDVRLARGARITGVRVASRRSHTEAELTADLVVDATGRSARTPGTAQTAGL